MLDIVQRIKEKERIRREKERKINELREKGEWDYHGESEEFVWTGSGEPDYS